MSNIELNIHPDPHAKSGRQELARLKKLKNNIENSFDSETLTRVLVHYIFSHHPFVLDLPPSVAFRFGQSQRVFSEFGYDSQLLTQGISDHFEEMRRCILGGFTIVPSVTYSEDSIYGNWGQKVFLPTEIQNRILQCNEWVMDHIDFGNIEQIINKPPNWTIFKMAEGQWLPVGNIMVEVAQGLARIRTPVHDKKKLLQRWGLGGNDITFVDLSDWFVMTHIVDRELLQTLDGMGKGMIHGQRLTSDVYLKAYKEILELIKLNHELNIKGVLSDGTWIYNPQLLALFPDQGVSGLSQIAGDVVPLGSAKELGNDAQLQFALGSQTRRKAFQNSEYSPQVVTRFIPPVQMENFTCQM